MDLKTLHRVIAAFLLIFSWIIYLSTVAPTLSFWDCGEFIACSVIMGVPHPPGSPLFLLTGHLFSLIPFGDVGWRVNLISTIVSALTVWLLYLTIVRLVRFYRGKEETLLDGWIVYGGSAVGALTFAFTHSFWFNAVEAEVYAASMFLSAIVFYLIVRWAEEADDPASDRLLLIIAYIFGLAIGVHLLNILAIPAIALVIYFRRWKFTWSSFFAMLAITLVGFVMIYPGIIKYLPATFKISWSVPVLIFIGVLLGCYYTLKARQRVAFLVLASTFLIILGYSTYGYIYIRSSLNPNIDENNPDTIERFLAYINREQYGDVGIFPRRWNNDPNYSSEADFFWRYQIDYMYNRYFLWQFVGMEGDFQGAGVKFSEFYALPLILGFWGLAHHVIKDKRRALVILTLFFMTGYAIIIYVNQDNPQPRERDYSYVGSFYAFAVWIGIGAQGLLDQLREMGRKKKNPRLLVAAGLALLLLLLPLNMLAKSYRGQSRKGNYVAWDYSRNMLETCAPNAVIFTNGDNDTFPLWYLQEVENIRKDVRVINLSLLNTGWYILQLKHTEPKVPMTFSDDYINRYLDQHDMTALRMRYWPKNDPNKPTTIRLATPDGGEMVWDVPATLHLSTGPGDTGEPNFLRVQDIMIIDIIRAAQWKKPIYFAVTVSTSNMLNLRDHLTMEGLAFRLNPEAGKEIDPDRLLENLLVNYRNYYRNLDNPKVHYDDNIFRLLQNYRSAFLQLATYYLEQNQTGTIPYNRNSSIQESVNQFADFSSRDKVLFILDCMEHFMPEDVIAISQDEIVMHLGRLYADLGRPEELIKRLNRLTAKPNITPEQRFRYGAVYLQWAGDTAAADRQFSLALKDNPDPAMKLEVATAYRQMGRNDEAEKLINEVRSKPLTSDLEMRLGSAYIQMGQLDQAEQLFREMLMKNPNDGSAVGGLLLVYERKRDYPAAVQLLRDWTTVHPNDVQATRRMQQYQRMLAEGSP
jgi:tetratricopeptide (TPR) repeat protein